MPIEQLIVLAIVQGITEFLPISSQAHLILLRMLFEPEAGVDAVEVGVTIDVALHVGSLLAVLIYFARETRDAVVGPFTLIGDIRARRALRAPSKLALLLVIATIPALAFGLALELTDALEAVRGENALLVIGLTTVVFGALLYISDRFFPEREERRLETWSTGAAIWMGLAQAVALIPGVSRSGVCMTMGRFLGYGRVEAARIAMLMAIPTILAAGGFKSLQLIGSGDLELGRDAAIAAGLSFLSAYAALAVMMRLLVSFSFTPYVIYRMFLGGGLLLAWGLTTHLAGGAP
ncbi:MAG: undecaprenyl-diphosphate phosphatase [Pseudomonadota bacterium]